MEKRMTSHFDQLRLLVIDAVNEKFTSTQNEARSILSEESQSREEAILSENSRLKEKVKGV